MNERARRADPEVERLFLAFRSGDREALSELVVRTTPWLQAVARRCGARGAEVDEVVQDAWIEASAPTCALPDALALLLLAGLARHGRSQAPWWFAAAAAASLAGGYAALAETSPSLPPEVAFAAPAEPRALGIAAVGAVSPAVIAAEERDAAAAPAQLSVLVRDAAGAPLPGVGIELAPVAGLDPLVHLHRACTGADGIATFAALPPVAFRLRTDRGVGAEVLPQQGSQRLELQAPAGRTVRGQVVDAEGQPVPGAAIWLATRADEPLVGTEATLCDAAGAFTLAAVPAAAAIAARAPGRGRIAAMPVPADGWC